ncbi:MAG: hypothetical protein BJ554DRAFT_2874 [Olpidium bornovanus]|uniref:Uncharacterized protein n=1 Tax=Olpidium bornovanus TaxID=278681 RepID=A0A8H8DFY9_9FUNG|nr:MAG: hypothetical protein BJ554DRAFT_2874 [Olpidium bornovanus]
MLTRGTAPAACATNFPPGPAPSSPSSPSESAAAEGGGTDGNVCSSGPLAGAADRKDTRCRPHLRCRTLAAAAAAAAAPAYEEVPAQTRYVSQSDVPDADLRAVGRLEVFFDKPVSVKRPDPGRAVFGGSAAGSAAGPTATRSDVPAQQLSHMYLKNHYVHAIDIHALVDCSEVCRGWLPRWWTPDRCLSLSSRSFSVPVPSVKTQWKTLVEDKPLTASAHHNAGGQDGHLLDLKSVKAESPQGLVEFMLIDCPRVIPVEA